MNTNTTFELSGNDLEEVNGGILICIIVPAFVAGFRAGRAS